MIDALRFGEGERGYNRDVNRHEFFKQLLDAPMSDLGRSRGPRWWL